MLQDEERIHMYADRTMKKLTVVGVRHKSEEKRCDLILYEHCYFSLHHFPLSFQGTRTKRAYATFFATDFKNHDLESFFF